MTEIRSQRSDDRNQKSEVRGQRSDDRVQITDAGNQMARIVHSSNPFDLPASFIERCLTLYAMPFALCSLPAYPIFSKIAAPVSPAAQPPKSR